MKQHSSLKKSLSFCFLLFIAFCFNQKASSQTATNMVSDTGKVGVGTLFPSEKLQVCGKVMIDSATTIKDSLTVQKDVVIEGNAIVSGSIGVGTTAPAEKLDIIGNAKISGDLKIGGNFTFAGNKQLSFLPAFGGSPEIYSLGSPPSVGAAGASAACSGINIFSLMQTEGIFQSWGADPTGTQFTTMSMGFDGANGIIDVQNTNSTIVSPPSLLINYYCGKDIYMCTGAEGGNIIMGTSITGSVGIGTSNFAGYKLAVNGKIRAKEIVVETGWSDFVFAPTYKLMPLETLEKYIKANKHLPEVPSAEDIIANGLKVAETQTIMMQKIEELTLYLIEQNKKMIELQAKIVELEKSK